MFDEYLYLLKLKNVWGNWTTRPCLVVAKKDDLTLHQ